MAADEPREQKDAKRPESRSRPEQSNRQSRTQKTRRGTRVDVAKLYIEKQVAEQTPMVFVTLDAALHTTVVEHGTFQLGLQIDGAPTPVDKLTLQYQYKQVDADTVSEKVVVDEAATSRDSAPPSAYKERHHLSARDLWHARKQDIPVRFSLRGGDVFTGLIEWFTRFEVKLNIGTRGEHGTASVILYRHAVLRLKLLEESKTNPSPDESGA